MKYYLFKVKMGHVGTNYYLPMSIAITGKDIKHAVSNARNHPGVKRDHKDWCLEIPKEITKEEHNLIRTAVWLDPYWNKETRKNVKDFRTRLVQEVKDVKKRNKEIKKYNRNTKYKEDYLNYEIQYN